MRDHPIAHPVLQQWESDMTMQSGLEKRDRMVSFVARIVKELSRFPDNVVLPDSRHNVGKLLAQTFLWDTVAKYAEKQSAQLWDTLRAEGHIPAKDAMQPGDHALAESPHLVCSARVSEPVKRFNGDALAGLLFKSKYKVPLFATKEMIDKAKIPTKSTVTFTIAERE